jgi:hypothetical protein
MLLIRAEDAPTLEYHPQQVTETVPVIVALRRVRRREPGWLRLAGPVCRFPFCSAGAAVSEIND